mmetsp:Transcript_11824/g.21301  ORF Transcript_11824/g.21301 Transcript_11824/m.21301 type:complete len:202 (-) Transcript_11824:212-817(-)
MRGHSTPVMQTGKSHKQTLLMVTLFLLEIDKVVMITGLVTLHLMSVRVIVTMIANVPLVWSVSLREGIQFQAVKETQAKLESGITVLKDPVKITLHLYMMILMTALLVRVFIQSDYVKVTVIPMMTVLKDLSVSKGRATKRYQDARDLEMKVLTTVLTVEICPLRVQLHLLIPPVCQLLVGILYLLVIIQMMTTTGMAILH